MKARPSTVVAVSVAEDIAAARVSTELSQRPPPQDTRIFGVALALAVKNSSQVCTHLHVERSPVSTGSQREMTRQCAMLQDSRVPIVVQLGMDWLNDRLLSVRGAWRGSSNASILASVQKYHALFEEGSSVTFPTNEDPTVITTLLLNFIDKIPEGLINTRATTAICNAGDKPSMLAVIISALSTHSKHLLARVFHHLHEMSEQQFMDATELAKCFSSHIGRWPDDMEDKEGALGPKDLVVPLTSMIKNYTTVFGSFACTSE